MIRYALRCDKGHEFDGWFRSSDGFSRMRETRQISCAECGSTEISKALMAPTVPSERKSLAQPDNKAQHALAKLREHVETHSDYVGTRFADEARLMHQGDSPNRAIHGEAKPEEAKKLLEDGIPVMPLPFLPRQKDN